MSKHYVIRSRDRQRIGLQGQPIKSEEVHYHTVSALRACDLASKLATSTNEAMEVWRSDARGDAQIAIYAPPSIGSEVAK